jgi:glycosyltransferase involved in cell wall biosynthesis
MSAARRVVIWTGADPVRWSAADLGRAGLGGTETAVVRVAEELAALGHEVAVRGEVDPLERAGVSYGAADPDELDGVAVLWLRMPGDLALLARPRRGIAWVHDRALADGLDPSAGERLDGVLALSGYHRDLLASRHPELAGRIRVVGNGVDADRFAPEPGDAGRAPLILFSSQPERGLDVMLELWPEVRERVPEAKLVCTHAPIYDRIADRPWVAAHRDRISSLSGQPGVLLAGALPRERLVDAVRRARVWAHPSWASAYAAPFDELSCIAAMEAQAAGCCVVASAAGALPETVEVGELIALEGAPGEPWRGLFLEALVAGLTDDERLERALREGPAAMRERSWASVAGRISAEIER